MAVSEKLYLGRADKLSFAWEKPRRISKDIRQFMFYKSGVFETCNSSVTVTSMTLMHHWCHDIHIWPRIAQPQRHFFDEATLLTSEVDLIMLDEDEGNDGLFI